MPTVDTFVKISRSPLNVALISMLTVLAASACFNEDKNRTISAKSVCGGLSGAAASAIEKVTASESFRQTSSADLKSFTTRFSYALKKKETKPQELCRIHPERGDDPSTPRISFELYDRRDIPPDRERKVVGEMDFPFSLQAVSTYTYADVYFECRSSDTGKAEEGPPVIHGNFSYGHRLVGGEGGLSSIKLNMDILQHVARNVAGELGCENHGDIPKRDKPW